MARCQKCGDVLKNTKSQWCLKCWEKFQKESRIKYGTGRCAHCKTKITGQWKYCPDCKKKFGK